MREKQEIEESTQSKNGNAAKQTTIEVNHYGKIYHTNKTSMKIQLERNIVWNYKEKIQEPHSMIVNKEIK